MRVSDILEQKGRDVVTVPVMTSVQGLAKLLRARRIGAAVVVNDDGAMAGIVCERDIVHCVAGYGEAALHYRVDEIMSTSIEVCGPEDDLKHVMATMTRHRVRHLPVLERGHLVGIISIGDAVKHRLEENMLEISVLRDAARAHSIADTGAG